MHHLHRHLPKGLSSHTDGVFHVRTSRPLTTTPVSWPHPGADHPHRQPSTAAVTSDRFATSPSNTPCFVATATALHCSSKHLSLHSTRGSIDTAIWVANIAIARVTERLSKRGRKYGCGICIGNAGRVMRRMFGRMGFSME